MLVMKDSKQQNPYFFMMDEYPFITITLLSFFVYMKHP